MTRTKKLWIALAGVPVALLAGTGLVFAVWTTTGTGTGAGDTSVAQSLTVNPVASSNSILYPGGPAGYTYFNVSNPNPFAVTLTSISFGTPLSTNPTACPSAHFSLDPSAPTTLSVPIGASSTSGALQVFNVVDLAHSAPNSCQGVAFNVPDTVAAAQQ